MWQMQGGSSKLNTFDCPRWKDLEVILMTDQIDNDDNNDNDNDNCECFPQQTNLTFMEDAKWKQ